MNLQGLNNLIMRLLKKIPKIVNSQLPVVQQNIVQARQAEKGQRVEAKTFMRPKSLKQEGPKPDDPYLHSIRIKQMAKKGDLETALHYFNQRLQDRRLPYNTVIFNTVIDVLGHAGRFRQAERVYEEMRRRSIPPDQFTFSSLLMALSKNEDETLRKEIDKTALILYEAAVNYDCASVSVFNNMLSAMSKQENSSICELFPVDMTDPKPDKFTFTIMLRHLSGTPLEVWRPYYDRLIRDSIRIDGPLMTALLRCVRLANPRPPPDFFDPFMTMIGKKMTIEPFDRLTRPSHSLYMDVLRCADRHEQVIDHYENIIKPSMDHRNVDSIIIGIVWKSLIKMGRGKDILSEFERLRTKLYYIPNAADMMAIVEACRRLERFECCKSYLTGYVVNGRVIPSAELLVRIMRIPEMQQYASSTLLPFVESKHAAVHLEYSHYMNDRVNKL